MDKDAAIRAFIKKRELFRLLTFIILGGLVLYGIIIPDFFPAITMGEYEKAYRISVMLWVATTFFLGEYVSGRLSICPICHIQIPTVTPRKRIPREKYGKQPGLGPLPDFCPFCGANFRDNK